ncbi:hypothetical protein L249_0487 [Ophiocordyceps polyrhachis-furcata BCC 54312]|uniref:Nephrocystin 3-like N-terminal domain-containing protein n=1 Tax=Ophiocordyceps polyrhachis-furcata BCC 54312 TaxID=1330021 RepID=A0A367LEW8_9HYPO|nr:hypothetical protein L249_0487 [Ophiocordyceps polyrhachis-furcata BCC 54312]
MTTLDDPSLYTIGWIAALPIERAAATALLDDRHSPPKGFEQHQTDTNSYTWGRIGAHNIVIASLPAGIYGTTSAATTASSLLSSLPQVKIGLLVGIGGAVARPDRDRDIRLGDVVISQPQATEGGVVQYDVGKAKLHDVWERKGSLNMPPQVLLSALGNLQAEHEISPSKIPDILQAMGTANPRMMTAKNSFAHQGSDNDRLFMSTYDHEGGSTCAACDAAKEIQRRKRDTTDPEMHYGIIASGNRLIKDAITRDRLASSIGDDCICFEMEAAGLMNHYPCLVIRGICDYADSHKNDRWQRYASATAAAYAKELLAYVPAKQLQATQRAVDVLETIGDDVKNIQSVTTDVKDDVQGVHALLLDIDQKATLRRLEPGVAVGASFNSNREPTCLPGTRSDLLKEISSWAANPDTGSIFWLMGATGTGKSTIARTVARSWEKHLGASFFFQRGETDRGNLSKFFSTIAAELTEREPAIAKYIKAAAADRQREPVEGNRRSFFREKFNKLVLKPLEMVAPALRTNKPVVIVVDGLNECEPEDDVKIILNLFSHAAAMESLQLKMFLTSNPRMRIRLGIRHDENVNHELNHHRMPTDGNDIRFYLSHEMAEIRQKHNASTTEDRKLPQDWPGPDEIESLVKLAAPLFVSAATMCRFIAEGRAGTPDERLRWILSWRGCGSQLTAAYMPVLLRAMPDEKQQERRQRFRSMIGPLVILAGPPLSRPSLARLLDVSQDEMDDELDLMRPVLDIPTSATAPVRLLHPSFGDYLLDHKQCADVSFLIDGRQAHKTVALNCLRVMDCLRRDICGTKAIRANRSTIGQRRIDSCIPPQVQYACVYWVYHVQNAGYDAAICDKAHSFLQSHRLHWMEALALLGKGCEVVRHMTALQSVFADRGHDELCELLNRSVSFAAAVADVLDSSPLQIYTARSGA